MIFTKKINLFVLLLCLSLVKLSAENQLISTSNGAILSNSVYTTLKQKGYSPKTQALINNGENAFPYNVYLDFPSRNDSNTNLIFVFYQEQFPHKEELLLNFLQYIHSNEFNFNITVLFSYGEKQIVEKKVMIYGSEVYISSLSSSDNYTAFIVDLENENNKIITSSNGTIAPAWLIKNEFNIYLKEDLKNNLPFYYVSQIYNMKFFNERDLNTFLENNIPGIKLCFNTDDKTINTILTESIVSFSENTESPWEHHFLLVNLFGKYICLNETFLIKIIISIVFSWLLFIFLLGFVNIQVRNITWYKVKKIWYSIPVTFILTYIAFISVRAIVSLFADNFTATGAIYFCVTAQIGLSFLFINLIYILILLLNFKFTEKSIDFQIVLACFINQSLFILTDISLFPIFMTIFLLSIISYYIKNNGLHIVLFILMILALFPYANTIITKSNPEIVKKYIFDNNYTPLAISITIYPVYLMYLRILTSFRNTFKKTKTFIIFNIISYGVLVTLLSIFLGIRHSTVKNTYELPKPYKILETEECNIQFNYSDKNIFTDIIRTIEIDLPGIPEVCDIRINSYSSTPILYSDNEYVDITSSSVIFKIPENPPSHLTFSYGANKEPCNIVISALYPDNIDKLTYKMETKVISIGEQ